MEHCFLKSNTQGYDIGVVKNPWKVLGPGGGGAMFIPTVSPHNADMAMVVCDMTGAYITHDGGKKWAEINLKTRVDSIAFHPLKPLTLYAGSSGLFRSEDGGNRWSLIFPSPDSVIGEKYLGDEAAHYYVSGDNWPGGAVCSICPDPGQPDYLFIGVNSGSLQIFSSSNSGESWKKAYEVKGKSIHKLYIDPTSPFENRILYIFTDTTAYKAEINSGKLDEIPIPSREDVIISADCGINPDTGMPVFYTVTPVCWENGKMKSGIFRSLDRGYSWHELEEGLDRDFYGPENGQLRRFSGISVAGLDCRKVYLSVLRSPEIFVHQRPEMNYQGMLISSDMGDTWDWTMKMGEAMPENVKGGWLEKNYDTDWVGSPIQLAVCPTNPEICYYTGIGMVGRTADGGKTWEQLYCDEYSDQSVSGRCIEVTTCYGVHFDPFDKNHKVISYTDIGMFQSFNGGDSWIQAINGVPRRWINTCYWLEFDPEIKGKAWSAWSEAHDLPREKLFRNDHFAHYKYAGGICRSENGITSWQKSNEGMPEDCVTTHIVLDPQSPAGRRTLYAAGFGKGVYKSVDDGHTWALKNNGLGENLNAWRILLLPDGALYLVIARGKRQGKIIDGEIFRSTEGAEHWEKVLLPDGVNAPNDLVFDPENPERMYLACWPYTQNGDEVYGGAYITENGGKSWDNIFDRSSYVYGLALHPDRSSEVFLVNFEGSAYRSENRGISWKRVEGYNFKWGHRPIVDPYNKDMLYITTFGSSVWHGPARGI